MIDDYLQLTVWSLLPLMSAVLAAMVLVMLRGRSGHPSQRIMRLLLVGICVWCLGSVIESASVTLAGKLLGLKIAYIGIVFVPVAWILWISSYTGRYFRFLRRTWPILIVVPLISLATAWSNDFHGLMWIEPGLRNEEGLIIFQSVRGPWWLIHASYSYILTLAGFVVLAIEWWQERWTRSHLSMLMVAAVIPLLPSLMFVAGQGAWLKIDPTSSAFAVTLTWLAFIAGDPVRQMVPVSRSYILDRIRSAIFVLDQRGEILASNLAAQALTMYSSKALIGLSINTLLPIDDSVVLNDSVQNLDMTTPAGRRSMEVRSRVIRDGLGRLLGSILLLADRSLEKAVRKSIESSIDARAADAESLESAGNEKSSFVASTSHELRAPLSSIVGFAELLKDGLVEGLNAQEQEMAAEIYVAGQDLLSRVGDILDFEKSEAGALHVTRDEVDVPVFMKAVCDSLTGRWLSAGAQLSLNCAEGVGVHSIDPIKMKQILSNLLMFIHAQTPEDGRLYLNVKMQDSTLQIEIAQSGENINAPDPVKWFNPYAEIGNGAREATRETRIGIALVLRLIELHDCKFTVTQRSSDWVKYRITVPPGSKYGEVS